MGVTPDDPDAFQAYFADRDLVDLEKLEKDEGIQMTAMINLMQQAGIEVSLLKADRKLGDLRLSEETRDAIRNGILSEGERVADITAATVRGAFAGSRISRSQLNDVLAELRTTFQHYGLKFLEEVMDGATD